MNRDFALDKGDTVFRQTINTYLYEAKACIDYDLGYAAIGLIDVILEFVARPPSGITSDSDREQAISRMYNSNWFITEESKEQAVKLIVKFISSFRRALGSYPSGYSPKVVMVKDRARLNQNFASSYSVLILDEFLEDLADEARGMNDE